MSAPHPDVASDPTDWFLAQPERGNPATRIDDRHRGPQAWSTGNLVRPLVHGATYFAALLEVVESTRSGDLVLFTDWQGDADERLGEGPDTEVAEVLARADERGVDVRGLVWRSHSEAMGFSSGANVQMGRSLQRRGAEALIDMRVRWGGSHHQKMVVVRFVDDPTRDVAFVGGIDLCHSRRDDADHRGDPQALGDMAPAYGDTPPWHDLQAEIHGPAVYDVETVFRERWEDPTPLSRSPLRMWRDRMRGMDLTPDPLPAQTPPPPSPPGARHAVQLLRTYPNLRRGRDYSFARGGERSVARGYQKALGRARELIYVEDQYVWGAEVGEVFTRALRENPDLRIIAVVPMHPDKAGLMARVPQQVGRWRAMSEMLAIAPGRVAFFAPENHAGTPVYVHAKTCIVDDTWATIGSDNFNRRSWTHDSELTAAVVDTGLPDGPGGESGGGSDDESGGELGYARALRLRLAAEHLDASADDLAALADPAATWAAFTTSAAALDAWHDARARGDETGPRPPGRLRRLEVPQLDAATRLWARVPYRTVHDPDGRPAPLKRRGSF